MEQTILLLSVFRQLLVQAMGFPPFQGGVLQYADRRGAEDVLQTASELYKLCPW